VLFADQLFCTLPELFIRRKTQLKGATLVLTCVDDGRISKADFHTWLDEALERTEDRALFGLGVRAESSG
jgi:hypothetical protein